MSMQGYVLCENVCVCCVHMFNNIRAVALYVPVQQIQVWLDLDTLQWISHVWCDAGNTEREQDCGCFVCAFKSHNCDEGFFITAGVRNWNPRMNADATV